MARVLRFRHAAAHRFENFCSAQLRNQQSECVAARGRVGSDVAAGSRSSLDDAGQLELAQRAGDGRSRRSKCFYELRFARKPLTWFVLAGCDRVRQGLPDFFVFRKRRFSRGFSNHAA